MLFGNGPGVDLISVAAAVKMAHSFTYCPHYCAFFVLGKRLVAVTKYWRAIKVLEVCETICAGGKLSTTPRQPANCLLYYIHTMRQHSVGMHLASTIEFLGGGVVLIKQLYGSPTTASAESFAGLLTEDC